MVHEVTGRLWAQSGKAMQSLICDWLVGLDGLKVAYCFIVISLMTQIDDSDWIPAYIKPCNSVDSISSSYLPNLLLQTQSALPCPWIILFFQILYGLATPPPHLGESRLAP